MTEEFWYDFIINDLENWGYRIEDIVLHLMTGLMMGITIKIKKIKQKLFSIFTK